MKIASLWERRGDQLAIKAELKRCDDDELKARVSGFLRGGAVVLQAPGLRGDRLDPSAPAAVPLGYVTDGEWIWPLELAYYLEIHDVLPEEALLGHARRHRFEAGRPAPSVLREASDLLTRGAEQQAGGD